MGIIAVVKIKVYVEGVGYVGEIEVRDKYDGKKKCVQIAQDGYFHWGNPQQTAAIYFPPHRIRELIVEVDE